MDDRPAVALHRRTLLGSLPGLLALGGASGLAGAGDGERSTLVVRGTGPTTRYEFETAGAVRGESLEGADTIWGEAVEGEVSTGADTYHLAGELTSFEITLGASEDVRVTLGGEPVAVTEAESHVLEIRGTGPTIRYSVAVSGSISGCRPEETDTVRLHGVDGQVSTGSDRYAYTGRLNDFTVTDGDPDDLKLVHDGVATTVAALDGRGDTRE